MAISSNLGFILGPALAGILGGTIYGVILPVIAALILSLITIIVIGFLLRESKPSLKEILVLEQGTIRKVFSQECRETYSTVYHKTQISRCLQTKTYFFFTCIIFFDIPWI
jgi:MFS transporter, DHA1 family, tetracycline resistance protein